jgi:RNA polymerase sigma-70 factor (ECF subfamily)
MGTQDERALLERVGREDQRAFEALYDLYGRSVYALAVSMLRDARSAEEVTQEVFLAIWRSARDFDARRGEPRSWILSLAHHKAVDAVRRHRVRSAEPLSETMTVDPDIAGQAIQSVEGARVRAALEALSPPQREAIALAYYGGYTQQEIAQKLGAPLGTVKTRMRDGMLRLRSLLGGAISEIGK